MRQVNAQTAKELTEMLLSQTGQALLDGDFDLFAQCFHLPQTIETPESKCILKTPADLRDMFERVSRNYRLRQVTDIVRITELAEFRSDDQIIATHVSHLMSGNRRISEPVPAYCEMALIDGKWKCTSSQYAVDQNTPVGSAIHAAAQVE